MKKIKFKIEYVPLSDAQIERHKDFDALMTAYTAHPKPDWKLRWFGNKLFIYIGGIITGAVLSSLIWYGVNHYSVNQNLVKQHSIINKETNHQPADNKSATGNFSEGNHKQNASNSEANAMTKTSGQNENRNTENNVDQQNIAKNKASTAAFKSSSQGYSVGKRSGNEISSAKNKSVSGTSLVSAQETASGKSGTAVKSKTKAARSSYTSSKKPPQKKRRENESQGSSGASTSHDLDFENIASLKEKEFDTLKFPNEQIAARFHEPDFSLLNEDSSKKKFQLHFPKLDVNKEWDATKNSVSKFTDSLGNKTSGLFAKLFKSDSSKKEGKSVAEKNDSVSHLSSYSTSADTFKHRFAQVSFVTPLGSDGINGKDYVHNLSFNVLQGYSGALNGFELGGLANVEKGYVKGAQIGGLVNFAFGDVNGLQIGGLLNNGKNVEGFQLGGIVNTATGSMNGFQLGGIANFARDSMNGLQLGGIANVSMADNFPESTWQIAGITNVSLGKTTGGEIAGIANVANDHHGIQIGLINASKKISGFQLGLINVSDSINGESLGLINVSRNGIHNVDVFGSEILLANAGFKLGSPHIYTQFAFGIRPYADLTRMGFGLGIGGHIPFDHGFVNIDGICWTIHNDNLNNWNNVNLWNQIRFMGGYQITKGVSIYAGPTLNAHVYDLQYPSIAPYTIYQHTSGTTRIDGWIGGVIGFQFF